MKVLKNNHLNGNMGVTSGGAYPMNPHLQQGTGLPGQQPAQGLTALLVMIAVLCILLAYCFWGAPWCRAFCRRRVCCFCPMDDPDGMDGSSSIGGEPVPGATPTIILLPFGRMLVVDGALLAQLEADARGLDLMELGQDVIRTQQYQMGSSPSIFQVDSETTSKGMSPILEQFPPPTYDSIYGSRLFINDMPPSYSEVSFQLRNFANLANEEERPISVLDITNRNRRNSQSTVSIGHERRDICPIAEEECDRIAASEEDIRESRV